MEGFVGDVVMEIVEPVGVFAAGEVEETLAIEGDGPGWKVIHEIHGV